LHRGVDHTSTWALLHVAAWYARTLSHTGECLREDHTQMVHVDLRASLIHAELVRSAWCWAAQLAQTSGFWDAVVFACVIWVSTSKRISAAWTCASCCHADAVKTYGLSINAEVLHIALFLCGRALTLSLEIDCWETKIITRASPGIATTWAGGISGHTHFSVRDPVAIRAEVIDEAFLLIRLTSHRAAQCPGNTPRKIALRALLRLQPTPTGRVVCRTGNAWRPRTQKLASC